MMELDRYQCEGCLRYHDAEETKQPILCNECIENLATVGICRSDNMYLKMAIKSALETLQAAVPTVPYHIAPQLVMYQAIGILTAVLKQTEPLQKE